MHSDNAEPPSANRGIPDLRWINRNVSVAEVARALDLRLDGATKIHCWHPERHQNGDRTASVGIRGKNNTTKCFVCDNKPMGPVDLVMNVLDLNGPADAALWIAERFSVPCIPKGKHLKQPARPPVRAGFEGDIGILVLSGLWAELSAPARCIVPVLLSHADREPGKSTAEVRISYRAISRYSGVASPNAVADAIRELENIGWLARKESPRRAPNPLRSVNAYLLTPQADSVIELAGAKWSQTKEAIEGERELRRRQRAERQSALLPNSVKPRAAAPAPACTQYKALYSWNSSGEIAAIRRIAGNWLGRGESAFRHSPRRHSDEPRDGRPPNGRHRGQRASNPAAQPDSDGLQVCNDEGGATQTAARTGSGDRPAGLPADAPSAGRLSNVRRRGRYRQAHTNAPGRNRMRDLLSMLPGRREIVLRHPHTLHKAGAPWGVGKHMPGGLAVAPRAASERGQGNLENNEKKK